MLTENDQARVDSHQEMIAQITKEHVPGVCTKVMATMDCLIPDEGGISLNYYGSLVQLIATSTHLSWPFKRLRFEGPIVEVNKMTEELWNKFASQCRTYAEEKIKTEGVDCNSNLRPPVIRFSKET